MKNWKKFLALLTAVLLVMGFAACTPSEEPSEEPSAEPTAAPTAESTDAPTEESTEAPTEAPTEPDYSAYMGQWYSGSVTFIVQEEIKWIMQDKGETFIVGSFVLADNGKLTLYDTEGIEVANMTLEDDGTLYAELYVEEMYNRVDDFLFTREPSEDTGDVFDDGGDSDEIIDG